MVDKLYNIVSQVFDIPAENLTDEDSPDTIESWNSLAHVNLVMALEAEFGLSLSPDEAEEMLSIGLIRSLLSERDIPEFEYMTNHE